MYILKDFLEGKFVINCTSEEDAYELMYILNEKGLRWCDGNKLTENTNYNYHEEETCYRASSDTLYHSSKRTYVQGKTDIVMYRELEI